MLVKATLSDAKQLTEIALKSKAIWGYSNELIESWREDLTVTSTIISKEIIYKFMVDTKIAGFYFLNKPKENSIELEMLFVLPNFVNRGIGKQLLTHSFEKAKSLDSKKMILLADPNAVPFYKSQGFYKINKIESSIAGRFLPVMQKDL
ncbi:GNAT family N-acetyltransferase [Polaribacter haliotis]|uniref:GNAT family N-acetyltransferase n=1 Tax=Polaribacter haliotis TaxID=1888915 RepID=A0A7L8ABT8_9FLAO|nr:GNAT family N-acetyltransferase [Polaribacter haliotis]QOD59404.1 GNAT family N-acetyltransferase [Polaribacter haliotis]